MGRNFLIYHKGYKEQILSWNINPVDFLISWLLKFSSYRDIIVDLGCGEAKIALKFYKNKVISFDIFALNNSVIISDLEILPCISGTIDFAIVSLSLMKENYLLFLKEIHKY